ncbi:MAG: hypothetical protein JOY64_26200, partial [Alphaproteobacteria bacterium]|nr:hypothetical protein [Alphaproteobacteria bacterium]
MATVTFTTASPAPAAGASITWLSPTPLDLTTFTLAAVSGPIQNPTATHQTIQLADGTELSVSGTGFTYDAAGNVTGGTTTEVDLLSPLLPAPSQTIATFANLSLPAAQAWTWLSTGNIAALEAAVFAGNVTITGGAGNDVLVSGPGNDTIDGGGGQNTVVYSGNEAQYSFSTSGST